MNLASNVVKGLVAFLLALPLSPLATASCSSADVQRLEKVAQAVTGSLPDVNYSAARRGRFEASGDQATGALEVKFSRSRRTLFKKTLNLQELDPDLAPGCQLLGRPTQGGPANGLFLRLSCQAPESTPGCAILIQPGVNRSGHSGWSYRVTGNRATTPAR